MFATGKRVFISLLVFGIPSAAAVAQSKLSQERAIQGYAVMQSITTKKVEQVLRRGLGSAPPSWAMEPVGQLRVNLPVLGTRTLRLSVVYSLNMELEAKGIVPRRQFMKLLRAA